MSESTTLPYVLGFASLMEHKLSINRHKGDRDNWIKDDPWSLVERLLDETVEVQQCFTIGSDGRVDFSDAEKLAHECADVANFAMMIADTVGEVKPKSQQDQIEQLTKERDEEKQWAEELAKTVCEMEDALGFKQDQTDKDGAFVPTLGPWKERVRDLIAKEGELGDLKVKCDELVIRVATLMMDNESVITKRDELAAKCAEMRDVIAHLSQCIKDDECYLSDADIAHALSDQCGQGWLSPEKKRVLVEALEYLAAECDEPVHANAAKQALEACK